MAKYYGEESFFNENVTFYKNTNFLGGNLQIDNSINIGSGVTISSSGVTVNGIVTATSINVGSGVTINSSGVTVNGIVTATSFSGSGASLTGVIAVNSGVNVTKNNVLVGTPGIGVTIGLSTGLNGNQPAVGIVSIFLDATLDDLSNVNVPSPAIGNVLQWNGSSWIDTSSVGIGNTLWNAVNVGAGNTAIYYNMGQVGIGTDQFVAGSCLSLGGDARVSGNISLSGSIAFIGNAIFNSNSPSSGICNLFMNGGGAGQSTGSNNVFIQPNAGRLNTVGNNNIFLGVSAGFGNTCGSNNIFLGTAAGFGNKDGIRNVAIGCLAGGGLTSGFNNVIIGANAGQCVAVESNNVIMGTNAGFFSTGGGNVYIGLNAAASNGATATAGDWNVVIGCEAGYNLCGTTNGENRLNVLIGALAGCQLTTACGNIIIGDVGVNFVGGNIYLPSSSLKGFTTESNRISIGHPLITNFYTKMAAKSWNYTTVKWDANSYELAADTSSCRFKTNIEPFLGGVNEILKLNSVKYNPIENPDGNYEIGLIAEQVAEAGLTELVSFDADNQPLSVSYDRMAALFINAIKELHQENQQLKQEIVEIKKHLDL